MKAKLMLALAVWPSACASFAEAQGFQPKERLAVANVMDEYVECSAFYMISAQCLKNRGDSSALAARTEQTALTFGEGALLLSRLIGVKSETVGAKLALFVDRLRGDIEGNCMNIAILLQRHALSCKALLADPQAAVERHLRTR